MTARLDALIVALALAALAAASVQTWRLTQRVTPEQCAVACGKRLRALTATAPSGPTLTAVTGTDRWRVDTYATSMVRSAPTPAAIRALRRQFAGETNTKARDTYLLRWPEAVDVQLVGGRVVVRVHDARVRLEGCR